MTVESTSRGEQVPHVDIRPSSERANFLMLCVDRVARRVRVVRQGRCELQHGETRPAHSTVLRVLAGPSSLTESGSFVERRETTSTHQCSTGRCHGGEGRCHGGSVDVHATARSVSPRRAQVMGFDRRLVRPRDRRIHNRWCADNDRVQIKNNHTVVQSLEQAEPLKFGAGALGRARSAGLAHLGHPEVWCWR